MAGLAAAGEVLAFDRSDDAVEARRHAESIVRRLRQAGMADGDIREMLEGLSDSEKPWLAAVADSVVRTLPAPTATAAPTADSVALLYAAALGRADTATTDSLRPLLARAVAADTLEELGGELRSAESRVEELQERVAEAEAEEEPHLLAYAQGFLDDLGIGFGWGALYFTAFVTALWHGQHARGKRLMGVRVVRLDRNR